MPQAELSDAYLSEGFIQHPLIEALPQRLITLTLGPDQLSTRVAEIRIFLSKMLPKTNVEEWQPVLNRLHKLLPCIVQPALLFLTGKQRAANNPTPDCPVELPLEELIQTLQAVAVSLQGELFTALQASLQQIITIYQDALAEWRQADENQRQLLLEPKAQLTGDSIGFYYLDLPTARELICRNRYGFIRKANRTGNHPVAAKGGIHFKPNPVGHDFVAPGMEYAAYSLYTLLGGPGLAAPTSLIKISQLPIEQINLEHSPLEVREKFQLQLQQGMDAEKILAADANLANELVKETKIIGRVVQAGQTIPGIPLDHLLLLLQEFQLLLQRFGQEQLAYYLPSLMDGSFYDCYLETDVQFHQELTQNEQFDWLNSLMASLDKAERLLDFDNLASTHKLQHRFKTIADKVPSSDILQALLLLKRWPFLAKDHYFSDIVLLPRLLALIPTLLPNSSPAAICQALPRYMERLDSDNFAALCLGSFLLNLADGKADNYMVTLQHDSHGNVVSWRLVGIDNDKALAYPITQDKSGKHYVGIKCLLYFFPAMQEPLSASLRERLLLKSPALHLLHWLSALYEQNQRYERLFQLDIITVVDRIEPDSQLAALDIPIKLDPTTIPTLYYKLQKLFESLQMNPNLSLRELFAIIEPIVAKFYASISAKYPDILAATRVVFHGGTFIEDILHEQLDELTLAGEQGVKTYREVLQTIKVTEDNRSNNRIKEIGAVVENFVQQLQLNFNQPQHWSVIQFIAKAFPFIQSLPLNQAELNKLLHKAVRSSDAEVVALLLRAGADVNCTDEAKRTALHLALLHQQPSSAVVACLLQQKGININAYDQSGYAPLCYLDLTQGQLLDAMLQYGADIDYPVDQLKGETLIDRAIRHNNLQKFLLLTAKGAGCKVDARIVLAFIQQYLQNPEWKSALSEALTKLIQQNNQVAWQVGLNAILQTEQPATPASKINPDILALISVQGALTGECFIKPAVAQQLFNLRGEVQQRNHYGRRKVAFIQHENQKLHFKFHPEMPLVEEGVRILARLLFEQGVVAETELFRFTNQQHQSYPVLLSQHVAGDNLQDVFKDPQKIALLARVDKRSFTELLLLTLLINPEDGKPDNYILSPFINRHGQATYRIMGIDNDHAFVEPVVREKGHRKQQLKTILYCLDTMLEPLDSEACITCLQHDPAKLVEQWLIELVKREERYDALFSEADRKRLFREDKNNPIITRMPFKPRTVAKIYEKFLRMQAILAKQPEITGLALLRQVIPLVGIAHEEAFKNVDTPGGRFHLLFSKQYSTVIAERYGTLVTGKKILESAGIPEEAMIAESLAYSPKHALAELRVVQLEQQRLKAVKDALLQGDIKPFNALFQDSSKEAVLQEVRFKELPLAVQKTLFAALEEVALRRLHIPDCDALDVKIFKRILQNSPHLVELDISGCSQFDEKILEFIADNNPALEKLDISRWPKLSNILARNEASLIFPALRHVWMNHCPQLRKIRLSAPCLQLLEIKEATQLTLLNLQGHELSHVKLENCPHLPVEQIEQLLTQSPKLLQNLDLKSHYPLMPKSIARFCSAYDTSIWTAQTIKWLTAAGRFDLSGILLDDIKLAAIIPLIPPALPVALDLRGCTPLSVKSLIALLKAPIVLTKLAYINYHEPLQPAAGDWQLNEGVDLLQRGNNEEVYLAAHDKTLRRWNTLAAGPVQVFGGHTKWILSATLLPDGNLVTGSYDKTIRVWDRFSGNTLRVLKGHAGAVSSLKYQQGVLISGSHDKTIKLWNVDTGKCLKTLGTQLSAINTLEIIAANQFACGTQTGEIKIWELTTRSCLGSIQAHSNAIQVLKKVSANLLASGASDNTIKLWDISQEKCLHVLKGHERAVCALELLSGGLLLASGSTDGVIKIWDVMSGQCLTTLAVHTSRITALCVLADGQLVSAAADGTLKIWACPSYELDMSLLRRATAKLELVKKPNQLILHFPKLRPSEDQDILALCQHLIVQGLGYMDIVMTVEDNRLVIEVSHPEKYVALEALLEALQAHIAQLQLNAWSAFKRRTEVVTPSLQNSFGKLMTTMRESSNNVTAVSHNNNTNNEQSAVRASHRASYIGLRSSQLVSPTTPTAVNPAPSVSTPADASEEAPLVNTERLSF